MRRSGDRLATPVKVRPTRAWVGQGLRIQTHVEAPTGAIGETSGPPAFEGRRWSRRGASAWMCFFRRAATSLFLAAMVALRWPRRC